MAGLFDDLPVAQQRAPMRAVNPFDDLPDAAPTQAAQAAQPQGQGYLGGMVDSFTNGYIGGFGPKATAAEAAVLGRTPEGDWFNYDQSMGERYRNALQAERAQNEQFQTDRPVSSFAGETGGVITSLVRGPMGALAKPLTRGATALANPVTRMLPRGAEQVGRAAIAGAAEGGVAGGSYALGEDRPLGSNALMGALLGAGTGAAVTGAGNAIGGWLKRSQTGRAARSAADDLADVRAASDTFEGENVAVSKGVLQRIKDRARQVLAEEAVDESMAPEAFRVFKTIDDKIADEGVDGISLKYLSRLRRRVSERAGTAKDGVERSASGRMLGVFDEVFDNLTPSDVVAGGDAASATAALREVNAAYKRMLKSQDMDAIIEKAPFYSGGGEKGIQQQIRNIGRRAVDPTKRGGTSNLYTKDDIEVLKQALDGTMGEKVLSQIGRMGGFSPSGGGSNALGAAIGLGGGASLGSAVGSAVGGPLGGFIGGGVGALGASAAGTAARGAAERNALARANLARALISGTKQLPPPNAAMRAVGDESNRRMLMEALLGLEIGAANR